MTASSLIGRTRKRRQRPRLVCGHCKQALGTLYNSCNFCGQRICGGCRVLLIEQRSCGVSA